MAEKKRKEVFYAVVFFNFSKTERDYISFMKTPEIWGTGLVFKLKHRWEVIYRISLSYALYQKL